MKRVSKVLSSVLAMTLSLVMVIPTNVLAGEVNTVSGQSIEAAEQVVEESALMKQMQGAQKATVVSKEKVKMKDSEIRSEDGEASIIIKESSKDMTVNCGEIVYVDYTITSNGNSNQGVYLTLSSEDQNTVYGYFDEAFDDYVGDYSQCIMWNSSEVINLPAGNYCLTAGIVNWNGSGWDYVEGTISSTTLHKTDNPVPLEKMFISPLGRDNGLLVGFTPESTTSSLSVTWSCSDEDACELWWSIYYNDVIYPYPTVKSKDVTVTATLRNGQGSASATLHIDENGVAHLVTPVTNFANRLYNKCLGRDSEEEGLAGWCWKLSSGEATGADVAAGFVFSEEYKNKNTSNEDFVEMLYNVFMDRASDEGGKTDWVDKLNNGMSREYVCGGFINSTEFAGICNNYEIKAGSFTSDQYRDRNYGLTSFMARCYTKALGRSFDADGLEYWCKAVTNGEYTIDGAATTGFFNSQEFANKNTTDDEYVTILYHTFFDREPDKAGYDDWMSQLKSGAKDRNAVMAGFSNSQEFANLKARYGL